MDILLSSLVFCMFAVILLSVGVGFIIFTIPGQSSYPRHPQGRDTMQVTEVFLNPLVDTKIRETAIDCTLEVEKKKTGCGGRADQVLRLVARGKGEYED
jgi:hypothetical protein